MVKAVRPGGTVLDLQVIRPNPRIEVADRFVCEVDGWPIFRRADAATAAIDSLIAAGRLLEEAVDDHDVRTQFPNGAELVADFGPKERRLPDDAIPELLTIEQPIVIRERCRLRRLAIIRAPGAFETTR
jgi:hypothetical protein